MSSIEPESKTAHGESLRGALKNMAMEYLRGIDALIRVLGTLLIISIFFAVLGGATSLANLMPMTDGAREGLRTAVLLLAAPLVVRYGVLAGGFVIPPLWSRRKSKEG